MSIFPTFRICWALWGIGCTAIVLILGIYEFSVETIASTALVFLLAGGAALLYWKLTEIPPA